LPGHVILVGGIWARTVPGVTLALETPDGGKGSGRVMRYDCPDLSRCQRGSLSALSTA
jgi:hypothetical protein